MGFSTMTDPFAVLGISTSATPAQIRTAFRRLALKHHPDRNPSDPRAEARFKRIVRAYRAALYGERPTRSAPPPAGPAPRRQDRFACGSCGDTFPFPERCPRCDVELFDGTAPSVEDPRVEAFVSAMEGRAPVIDRAAEMPVPGLVAGGFLGMAGFTWSIGPGGVALLFAGFAAYVVLIEGHRILRPAL